MATTPHDTSRRIDEAIDSLNAQWDLGLPKLHGVEADRAESGLVAEKCSHKIRFLYYKTDNIDALLADFTERARQIQSEWVFKPSLERGTLPVLPQTKSLVERDFQIKRKAGLVQLSYSQRLRLQEALFNILDENSKLARLTNSFSTEQASTASFTTAPSTPRKETVTRRQETVVKSGRRVVKASETVTRETILFASDEPQIKDPMTRSTKRTLGSPDGQNKRKQRQQTTLPQFFGPQAQQSPAPLPNDSISRPEQVSFETAPSPDESAVFSSVEEDEGPASNATSMISTQAEETQDLFPTQDYQEIFDDEQFDTSFTAACNAQGSANPAELSRHKFVDPFKVQAQLPRDVPFWYNWELFRIAPLLSLKPLELHKKLEDKYTNAMNDAEEFWKAVKELCNKKGLTLLPQKSDLPTWVTQERRYEDDKTNKTTYLTATLDWNDGPSKDSLQLRLNAIQLELPCRFHRKFGADRFLVLSTPSFEGGDKPLHKEIIDFLSSGSHFIAGRYWRICYVEDEKKSGGRKKITLFSERGFDILNQRALNLNIPDIRIEGWHREITVQALMEWHIPIDANLRSENLRLFSRWSLGFSKTIHTVEVHQQEFQYLPDEPGKTVMNDGCALMSLPLANAIWAAYGGEGKVPSAVQGRIGGAKGLWLVDYHNKYRDVSERDFWIEVSDSQLKIKPHPRDRAGADPIQRTFEVLKYAKSATQSRLNMQLITILEDRGVPRRVLQAALVADLESYSKTLKDAMQDPVALRIWLQQHGRSSRPETSKLLGNFPRDSGDQMELLLASGFHPRECTKLIKNAYKLLSEHMTNYMKKLWVGLPQSTTVFCAPDPLGVLAEDEVFIGFSNEMPVNDSSDTTLTSMEVLVARNPAYLPSDIQRRKAVFKEELRLYKNVILFSTRGGVPLASLLSGGDYDGDVCQVIWDRDFVINFQGVDKPALKSEDECGMVQMSRPLRQIFHPFCSRQDAFEEFLRGCVDFNARPHSLGVCSNEYQRLIYHLSLKQQDQKLFDEGAVTLAALAGFLVDSNKQGWILPDKAWKKLRREASGRMALPEPAYKEDHAPRKVAGTFPNVIDFLKFEVAKGLMDEVLADFKNLGDERTVLNYDISLSQEWHYWNSPIEEHKGKTRQLARLRSANTAKSPVTSAPELAAADTDILIDMVEGNDGLREMISKVRELWKSLATPGGFESTQDEPPDSNNFNLSVQTVYEKFRSIEPKNLGHELRRRYQAQKENPISDWALLRASCLHYFACHKGKFPVWVWYVAGRELCWLKAMQHASGVRPVVSEIHDLYRVDMRRVRALLDSENNEEIDVDGIVDDDENFVGYGETIELD